MSKIILVAESGSDITPEMAQENGIVIVPMHVSFGGKTYDDGAFPTTEMFDYYKKHRELPRTSGCTPRGVQFAPGFFAEFFLGDKTGGHAITTFQSARKDFFRRCSCAGKKAMI